MARRIDFQKLLMDGIPDDDGWLVKKVHVDELETDYSYQRFPKEASVNSIVKNWNPRFLGAFTVGVRANGKKMLLDGNHRKQAILRLMGMGESVNPYVRCEMLANTTQRIEAGIFVGKNTNNKVNGVALYKASLLMREEPHMTIQKILAAFDFEVELLDSGKPSPRNGRGLRGAPTILSAYKSAEIHFESAVKILHHVWKRETEAHCGEFLKGITTFLKSQVGSYNTNRLQSIIGRLKGTPASNGIELASVGKHSTARIKRLAKWMADVAGIQRSLEYQAAA